LRGDARRQGGRAALRHLLAPPLRLGGRGATRRALRALARALRRRAHRRHRHDGDPPHLHLEPPRCGAAGLVGPARARLRGHRPARQAQGLRRPQGAVEGRGRTGRRAQGVREGQDRALQVPALDRVRRRAAQDGDRQDPALQAPRLSGRARVFDRGLETQAPDALREHQWRRFQAMARELLGSNAFVRAKWRAAGLAAVDDLRGWDDFGLLPFTWKREFVEDQAAHPPFGTNLTYPLERYVRVHQTSGTSAEPIRWLETQASWHWWTRCWAFVLRAAGVTPADRVFFPFSFGL